MYVFDESAEEVAQERVKEKETVIRFLKEGVPAETIARTIPSFSIEDIKQLQQNELVNA